MNSMFTFALVGEVSPSAATPCCARVCVYPLYGGSAPRNAPETMCRASLGRVPLYTGFLAKSIRELSRVALFHTSNRSTGSVRSQIGAVFVAFPDRERLYPLFAKGRLL
jgi:hypothetical protein